MERDVGFDVTGVTAALRMRVGPDERGDPARGVEDAEGSRRASVGRVIGLERGELQVAVRGGRAGVDEISTDRECVIAGRETAEVELKGDDLSLCVCRVVVSEVARGPAAAGLGLPLGDLHARG